MNDLRKAAEMALEFVEWLCSDDHSVKPKNNALKTREALRQALAQEWVCCVCGDPKALGIVHSADAPCFHYTKREWVGLTDEDKEGIKNKATYNWDTTAGEYASEVQALTEAKLKEKNRG